MKQSEFEDKVQSIRYIYPVFKLINIPDWIKDNRLQLGDEFYPIEDYCDGDGALMVSVKNGKVRIFGEASMFEYVEHREL